jgi:mono/diheme cytochrome c family protein
MMRRLLVFAVPAALAFAAAAAAQDAATIEKGKAVFAGAKPACKMCHAIGGVGNAKAPLDKVGATAKADDIKAWIRTPKEMMAKKGAKGTMPVYGADKISDADLESLTAYLLSLK